MPRKQRNGGLMNEHQLKSQRLKAKRVTTVTDLLTRDDVNGILAELNQRKDKINHLIVLWADREGKQHGLFTDDTLASKAVYMLESSKFDLMTGDCEE